MENPYSRLDLLKAIQILSYAFVLISDRWTNQGYRIRQEDSSYKYCVTGAIDEACQHFKEGKYNSVAVQILQEVSLEEFGLSCVSLNDTLGYKAVTKLLALSIQKAVALYGFSSDPNNRRIGYSGA